MRFPYGLADFRKIREEGYFYIDFTAEELAQALHEVIEAHSLPVQYPEALALMRTFYNGYRFGDGDLNPCIYNPTLALYFLDYLSRYTRYPRRMLDDNLAMDRSRIQYVARLPHGETLVTQALNAEEPLTVAQLSNRFGVQEMLKAPKDPAFLASLLYYFGVLTLAGRDAIGKLQLTIPNLVIRKLYVEHLQERLLPDYTDQEQRQTMVEQFYTTGDLGPLCDLLEQRYFPVFNNRDLRWSNELVVKTAFLVTLFNDAFYLMDSEPALKRGYGDLALIVRPDMRQYALLDHLLEFRTLSLKAVGLTRAELATKTREELGALQAELPAAERQLAGYRATLEQAYGGILKLRTHAVVCISLERLVY